MSLGYTTKRHRWGANIKHRRISIHNIFGVIFLLPILCLLALLISIWLCNSSSGSGGGSSTTLSFLSSFTADSLSQNVRSLLLHPDDDSIRRARNNNTNYNITMLPSNNYFRGNNNNNNISSYNANGAFIHIGKTAGSALSVLLRNGCHSYMVHPCYSIEDEKESMASKLISTYYHVPDFGLLARHPQHDFYIISTRDPYERTVSAFVYEHLANRIARGEIVDPKKDPILCEKLQLAYSCFPSLEAFVRYLPSDTNSKNNYTYPYHKSMVVNTSCQDLARAAINGKVRIYNHIYFSYRQIQKLLSSQNQQPTPIYYVTRQEYLWDDWITINQKYLHQMNQVYIPSSSTRTAARVIMDESSSTSTSMLSKNSNKQKYLLSVMDTKRNESEPVSRNISTIGKQYLCNSLIDEYKAYFWFLIVSKNLNDKDVNNAIVKAKTNCPNLQFKTIPTES